jgi:dihydroorotate dehydrogenase
VNSRWWNAEWAHDRAIGSAEFASRHYWLLPSPPTRFASLETELAGLHFRSPLGLAAGFDKSGRAVPFWAALGFGHVEIGSISAEVSYGNPKPRLWRMQREKGILVWYGLPNDGCQRVAQRLADVPRTVPLGINIVNTNRGQGAPAETVDGIIADYVESVRVLEPQASYLTLNLSCPNTSDGRGFVSDSCRVVALLEEVEALGVTKPVFLKVAPFGNTVTLEAFLRAVERFRYVSGFGINLPPGKPSGCESWSDLPGAVAGKPSEAAMTRALVDLYTRIDPGRYAILATGGVFTAEDAYRRIRLGATLVQFLTALVYEGPLVVRRMEAGLARLVERDGFRTIREAIGVDCGTLKGLFPSRAVAQPG